MFRKAARADRSLPAAELRLKFGPGNTLLQSEKRRTALLLLPGIVLSVTLAECLILVLTGSAASTAAAVLLATVTAMIASQAVYHYLLRRYLAESKRS